MDNGVLRQAGRRFRGKWLPTVGVATLLLSFLVTGNGLAAGEKSGGAPAGAGTERTTGTSTARAQAGRSVRAPVSAYPRRYTKAQLKTLNNRLLETDDMRKGHPARPGSTQPMNSPLRRPGAHSLATTIVRDSTIPTSGISGGSNYASFTQEPSTDANGGKIFQTGNWYATRSVNGGRNWSYLDPFTLFGTGFCCDQVTQYDPTTGRQFWLLQYDNHLVLANASAAGTSAFTGWCYWDITPEWFGLPAGTGIDYNDMSITNSFVNISSNFFGSASSGAALLRLPKVPMSSCQGFSYNRLNRSDNFTFKLAPGSTGTLYFGSNWGQSNGSSFRVFSWPESSSSYSWVDRTVASYTFYTRNSGQNCSSTDGVVTNWCQYADSRVLGAYRTNGVIGFSFNAKQDATHPFPYTRIVWFGEANKLYLGSGDLWGAWGAIQFLSMAPNSLGRVGGVFAWGGGTETTHFYPGAATWSSGRTSVSTDPNFFLYGGGNTCTYGGLYRWGDYLTIRTFKANPARWIAAAYAIKGGNCGAAGAYAQPHNVLFF